MRRARNDEHAWIRRAREGDREAFGVLVKLHQDRVFNLAFRLTGREDAAWDLSQEAFLRAWEGISSFRGEAGFYTWIYRILLNLHMNREKSAGRRMERKTRSMEAGHRDGSGPAVKDSLAGGEGADPVVRAVRKETAEAVQAAIQRLAPKYRQVLLLRDMEGLSYEAIAELLDLPLGTVRSRLFRARDGVMRILERPR